MSTTARPPWRVLILCTGNSARSILAEAILNSIGAGRFVACSAGSFPKGRVHPMALDVLRDKGLPTEGLRSKSWDEFAVSGSLPIDIVITVCDNAAGEVCPIWPGHPVTAHWGLPDPAALEGAAARAAFEKVYQDLRARMGLLVLLPIERMEAGTLKSCLDAIGVGKTTVPIE